MLRSFVDINQIALEADLAELKVQAEKLASLLDKSTHTYKSIDNSWSGPVASRCGEESARVYNQYPNVVSKNNRYLTYLEKAIRAYAAAEVGRQRAIDVQSGDLGESIKTTRA